MKHKLLTLLLAIVASIGILSAEGGSCGQNLTWNLTDSVLTISGTGAMTDYSSISKVPWYSSRNVIQTVIISNSVTTIGDRAFSGCYSLTSVTIPNSVTSIGVHAFNGCSSLTFVHISNLSAWCNITFSDSSSNPLGFAHNLYLDGELITDLVIPSNITSIGNYTFYGCTGLISVTLLNNIDSVGYQALAECGDIEYVVVSENLTSINRSFESCHIGTLYYNTIRYKNVDSSSKGPFYSQYVTVDSIVLGHKVNYIPAGIYGRMSINHVELPNSVVEIAANAFYACKAKSITLGNSVAIVGTNAFAECKSLESITCMALNSPVLSTDMSGVFKSVDKSIPLYVPAESIDVYKVADQWKDFTNIQAIPDTTPTSCNISYVDNDEELIGQDSVKLYLPEPPIFFGFTFQKWIVVASDLEDGITIQAVYQADEPTSAPVVYTNPANPAQKLIREGNVYILTGDKTYTLQGQAVR